MEIIAFVLQLIGGCTVVFFVTFFLGKCLVRFERSMKTRKWRREYETDYERDQRKMARSVMLRHRLRLPELPTHHRAKDLSEGEEAAIRRAKSYYD